MNNKILLDMLKDKIKEHPKILHHFPPFPTWTRTNYEMLSKLIARELEQTNLISPKEKERLGTTISKATLERIYKNRYDISEPLDLRRQNTLDKLSVFIGHKSWHEFVKSVSYELKTQSTWYSPIQTVEKAIKAEFSAYQNLPLIQLTELQQYFIATESAYKRIIHLLYKHQKQQWSINNPYNPSTCELIDADIIKYRKNEIHIRTEEYWYLRWFDNSINKYAFIYNQKNIQLYILVKEQERWKVKVNFYESNNDVFIG